MMTTSFVGRTDDGTRVYATVSAEELRTLLVGALVSVSRKRSDLPSIQAVQIRRRGNRLEAIGTDRFSLTRGSIVIEDEYTGPDWEAPVDFADVERVVKMLPARYVARTEATLTLDDDRLTVDHFGDSATVRVIESTYPNVESITAEPKNPEAVSAIAVDPKRIAKLAKLPGLTMARLDFTSPYKPIRVEWVVAVGRYGVAFLHLIMPMRTAG